jgi:hypothetical protein
MRLKRSYLSENKKSSRQCPPWSHPGPAERRTDRAVACLRRFRWCHVLARGALDAEPSAKSNRRGRQYSVQHHRDGDVVLSHIAEGRTRGNNELLTASGDRIVGLPHRRVWRRGQSPGVCGSCSDAFGSAEGMAASA